MQSEKPDDTYFEAALKLIKLIERIIYWGSLPQDVLKRKKWTILANRLMSTTADDVLEYVNKVVKSISGEEVFMGKKEELADSLREILNDVKKMGDKGFINYIKNRAIPLVILVSAEKTSEKTKDE